MKKILKLLTIPSLTVAGLAPTAMLASCSNSNSIANDIISEFKKITAIPHVSDAFLKESPYGYGRVWELSCYLKERIESILGKSIFQDKYGNLVFDVYCNDDKYKDAPKIAIQAHMDMVFSYDQNQIPFEPDPRIWEIGLVEEEIDGKKMLHSDKWRTTIGADNGVGVAQIMALIQHNEIKHGDLRFIITNCEENGCQGATLLVEETYPDVLKDIYYLLNIDWEDVGGMCVACAGAVGSYYYINSDHTKESEQAKSYVPVKANNLFKVTVDGFPGGHSGVDISKRVDNALVFMNALMDNLTNITSKNSPLRLHSISTPGSTVYNSLPKACEVIITSDNWAEFTLDQVQTIIKQAFDETVDARAKIPWPDGDKRPGQFQFDSEQYKDVTLKVEQVEPKYKVALSVQDTRTIIALQGQEKLKYGVIAWPTDEELARFEGEQTSANVGPAEGSMTSEHDFEYKLSTYSRSTSSYQIASFFSSNEKEAIDAGAKYKYDAKFDPWAQDTNKQLLEMCTKAWKTTGIDESLIKPCRTHGGLECSLWNQAMLVDKSKQDKTACISYGPQIYDAHKFTERVEIDSLKPCVDTTIYIITHADELKIE